MNPNRNGNKMRFIGEDGSRNAINGQPSNHIHLEVMTELPVRRDPQNNEPVEIMPSFDYDRFVQLVAYFALRICLN